jgi:hypothetical protein
LSMNEMNPANPAKVLSSHQTPRPPA